MTSLKNFLRRCREYVTLPLTSDYQSDTTKQREKRYEDRVSTINWMGLGIGGAVAFTGSDTFAQLVKDLSPIFISILFAVLILATLALVYARAQFAHQRKKLESDPSSLNTVPPDYGWCTSAEFLFAVGYAGLVLIVAYILCIVFLAAA